MARMVVLEFEDTDAAEAFVQNRHIPEQLGFHLVSMHYAAPPLSTCGCGGKRDLKDWGKSKKFGIPVCKVCKKVSPFWVRGILTRLQYALGTNLLGDAHV